MPNCVIYARVSSKEQEQEGYSLPSQIALFRTYAKQKGLTIVKEYEEKESAKDSGRKLFNEMLAYVKSNKATNIIFEKVDRMTRNFKDLITIYDLMENDGISIHLIKNGLVLDKYSKSQDKLQLDLHVVLGRNYINNLSEEIKKGLHQKIKSGEWGHIAPFGYSNIRINGRATVIPNEKAAIVKEIFNLSFQGYSIQRIQEEIAPRCKIAKSYVATILRNPFYIGYMRCKGELYKGNQDIIIDPALFSAVQERLSKRNNKIDAIERHFRFSGVLYCACGSKMVGELKKGKYVTYGCHSKCENTPSYVSEAKIISQLQHELDKLTLTDEDMPKIQGMIKEMFEKMDNESREYAEIRHVAINKVKEKLSRLLDYLDEGLITKPEFVAKKEQLQTQLIKLESEYSANIRVPMETKEAFLKLFEPAMNLSQYWLNIDRVTSFQEVMRNYYSNLIVKDGKLTVTWTELGSLLYKRASCPEWWTSQDVKQNLQTVFHGLYCA